VSPEHAKSFGLARAAGVLVASVERDGPGGRAGLQIGDIILKINNKEISGTSELIRAVSDSAPGVRIKLQVWREGEAKEVAVVLGDAATGSGAAAKRPTGIVQEPEQLGMTLRELSREELRMLKTEAAIVVEAVNGIAAKSGIQSGDLIIAINSKHVKTVKQLREALDRADKRAAVLVQRGGSVMFIPLKF
jgi:serine protease Do